MTNYTTCSGTSEREDHDNWRILSMENPHVPFPSTFESDTLKSETHFSVNLAHTWAAACNKRLSVESAHDEGVIWNVCNTRTSTIVSGIRILRVVQQNAVIWSV